MLRLPVLRRFLSISSTLKGSCRMQSLGAQQTTKKLQGKVAVVTASTEGIGLAIVRRLAQDGARVLLSSRRKQNVERAVQELQQEGLDVEGTVCHVGKKEDREKLVDLAVQRFGGIDILVSNAAVNPFAGNIIDSTEEVWDKILDINVKATFLLVKLVVPKMRERGGGNIVIVSSVAGYTPFPTLGPYSVSKTALIGLTKALAPDLLPLNIRVNGLAPGLIRTKFSSVLWQDESTASTVKTVTGVDSAADARLQADSASVAAQQALEASHAARILSRDLEELLETPSSLCVQEGEGHIAEGGLPWLKQRPPELCQEGTPLSDQTPDPSLPPSHPDTPPGPTCCQLREGTPCPPIQEEESPPEMETPTHTFENTEEQELPQDLSVSELSDPVPSTECMEEDMDSGGNILPPLKTRMQKDADPLVVAVVLFLDVLLAILISFFLT
uniref:Dehydrogenase/reductase SDR family member 4 n=1 Tax=Leptobrachium leishanense TaxID=445787 RepID=A0A8C5MWT6_9ANUR